MHTPRLSDFTPSFAALNSRGLPESLCSFHHSNCSAATARLLSPRLIQCENVLHFYYLWKHYRSAFYQTRSTANVYLRDIHPGAGTQTIGALRCSLHMECSCSTAMLCKTQHVQMSKLEQKLLFRCLHCWSHTNPVCILQADNGLKKYLMCYFANWLLTVFNWLHFALSQL